jgi:hypothetical protein
MGCEARTLYESENGDRWHLVRDTRRGRVFVEHVASAPSGGQRTEIEIGAL